jgi:chromosomal replication initiator protein
MEIPIDGLWNHVLERLQLELAPPTFETWIKTAKAQQLENNCLVIYAPNPFARNWLQKYYIHTIANVVQDIVGYPIEIYITVVEDEEEIGRAHV